MGKKVVNVLLLMVLLMSIAIGHVSASPNKDTGASTVKGSIKDGGSSLKNSLVILQEKGKSNWIHAMTDGNGSFKTKLSDGTYAVKGIKGKKTDWYSTHKPFVVKEGKIKGLKDGEIILSEKKPAKKPLADSNNFNGVLKEGTKGLKANFVLWKYSEYEEEFYSISSKGNGSFSASLPDGSYFLYGVEVDGGFYRHEIGFTVDHGNVFIDGVQQNSLSITIPVNAYTGKVADSTSSLSEAAIIVEKLLSDEEYETEFIQYVLTNKKGEFSLRKLPDGLYAISVYHDTYSSWNNLRLEVVNGTIYVDGEKVSSLQITVPDVNVKGTLSEGKQPIPNAYVNFEGETPDGDYEWYWAQVDSKGNFQYRLPDGNYSVSSVDEQNRSTMINISFEIREGKLFQNGEVTSGLNIKLPPVTFNGKLVDEGNVLQGEIYVEGVSQDGSYEWYHASTDESGIYSLRLKDGSYQLMSGYLFDEGEDVAFYVSFDIVNGKLVVDGQEQSLLELQVPPVSVYGLVKDGDSAVEHGWVSIISEDQNFYSGKSINSDGTFTMRLADGNYKVWNVDLWDGTSATINQSFSIQDGKTYVNGVLQDMLEIAVPPVTLAGTLSESGNPVMGGLYIMETNNADNPLEVWGWANEEGRFQFRLPDGDYKVYNVYLNDGSEFRPEIEFSIVSGKLYVNGELSEQLNITVPPVTVTGTVYNGKETVIDGYVTIATIDGDWIADSWIQDGYYKGRLPDGEYLISMVNDFQYGVFYFEKKFIISDAKLFVDGGEVSSLDINLQDGWQEPIEP